MPQGNQRMRYQGIPLLDRYLFWQLLPPFGWGIGAFSAIGVSAAVLFDLLRQVSDARLPLTLALSILVLQLPYFISLSIPMSVLLTCLLTFSRLQTDGELMALQAAGLSVGRLMRTSVCFSLLASIFMFIFAEGIVPASQYQAQQLLVQAVQTGNFELQNHHIVYEDYGPQQELRRLFYAEAAEGQTLQGLTVIDLTTPEEQQIMWADSATWNAADQIWTFKNGTIYSVSADSANPYIVEFTEQQLQLSQQPVTVAEEPNTNTMTLAQAQQALIRLQQQENLLQRRALEIQIHRKVALPFTVLVFGLVGSSLGMSQRRLSASNGFGVSLVFVLVQYLLIFAADAWSRLGWFSPWWGAWLPNMIVGLLGLGLLVRLTGGSSVLRQHRD